MKELFIKIQKQMQKKLFKMMNWKNRKKIYKRWNYCKIENGDFELNSKYKVALVRIEKSSDTRGFSKWIKKYQNWIWWFKWRFIMGI